jgi:hypothetical protein
MGTRSPAAKETERDSKLLESLNTIRSQMAQVDSSMTMIGKRGRPRRA